MQVASSGESGRRLSHRVTLRFEGSGGQPTPTCPSEGKLKDNLLLFVIGKWSCARQQGTPSRAVT